MTFSIADINFKKLKTFADWKLLLFLLFFLDVKLVVKVPAIIIIYLLQFDIRFGFSLKNSRLPLFYLLVIAIAFINLVLNINSADPRYLLVFFNGVLFWLMCILAIHQVKLSVENNVPETIHNTILLFFVINAAFSFFTLAHIMWETGAINPYRYQGEYQKYFICTGDYIKGVSFDTSTTNAVLNAFGVIYFLIIRKPLMVLICMVVMLLTGSNFIDLSLLLLFIFLFIFRSSKDQKSIIVVCSMFLVVFMAKISPQNSVYATETVKNIIHPQIVPLAPKSITKVAFTPEEIKRQFAQHYIDSVSTVLSKRSIPKQASLVTTPVTKTDAGRILIPGPDINTKPYQTPTDTTPDQQVLITFIDKNKSSLPVSGQNKPLALIPGKAIAVSQTVNYLDHHPTKAFTGAGMGNFSSKLAFRATGLGFAGGYPAKYVYINPGFFANHLDLYLNFFSKNSGQHSLTNSPYAVYDQLLGEYGLLGLFAFLFYYLFFFAKHYKKLTYGLPLLLLLIPVLFIDYWFEQLSVIVFFELLLLLNIKETATPVFTPYEN
jgi:hypothetical protein